MKTLRAYFDNGEELEELPSMVQEAANLEYSLHNRYFEAVDKKNRRIAECRGWYADGGFSIAEFKKIKKTRKADILDFLEQDNVDLTIFNKADQALILAYAKDVLTEILKEDKN